MMLAIMSVTKFSEAMSSSPAHWRCFSFSIRSWSSGSCSSSDFWPGRLVGMVDMARDVSFDYLLGEPGVDQGEAEQFFSSGHRRHRSCYCVLLATVLLAAAAH